MANVTNASTQDIYDRLSETQGHHPFEADTFASWATQAGDVVTMKSGEDEYDAPVYSTRMVWKGTPQTRLSSTGNKERDSVSKVGKKKYGRGGAGMRAQQGLYYDMYSEDGQLHSSLMMTESVLRTQFEAANSTLYSVIQQTATQVFTGVYDTVSGTFSTLEQTASMIRTSVSDSKSVMYSAIMQTASGIRTEVADLRSGLRSTIEQLPDKIELAVGKATSGIYGSVISMTSSYIMTAVRETASSIAESVIIQTEEVIMSEVRSTTSAIAWSVITQTMTNIEQEIGRKAQIFVQPTDPATDGQHHVVDHDIWIQSIGITTWGQFGVEGSKWNDRSAYEWRKYYGGTMFVRKNGAWQQVTDSSDAVEMSTKIDQTDEYIALLAHQTDLKGEEYMASLRVTAKEVRSEVSAAKSTLYSTISQTATNILMQVADTERDLQTSIEQTAERVSISASAARSELFSHIEVTATYIRSQVANVQSGLESLIEQTPSMIRSEVISASTEINRSIIQQTASSITLAVTNAKTDIYNSQIKIQKERIDLVVQGSGSGASIRIGNIVDGINNQTGQSTVYIGADKIKLDGYTIAHYITADYILAQVAEATTVNYNTLDGQTVYVSGSLTSKNIYFGDDEGDPTGNLKNSIWDLQIVPPSGSSNTYKLQRKRFNDSGWTDVGSFSRAVTDWSYSWSGGQLTVTALPQNNSKAITGVKTTGSWSNNVYNGRVVYWDGTDDDGTTYNTGATFSVSRAIEDWGYSWDNGQLTVAVSPQNVSTKLIGVRAAGSWSNGEYNGRVVYWAGTDDERTWPTGATFTLSDSDLVSSNIKNGVTIFGVTGSYSGGGGGGSISITPDNVGHSSEPDGTRIWSTTTLLSGKWYKFTVTCGDATKVYKIYIN